MSDAPRRTHWHDTELTSVSNDTKWEKLRLAVHALDGKLTPRFRTMDINGYYAPADSEWCCHFRAGGYETTRYADLFCHSEEGADAVLAILKSNSLHGHPIEGGFRVYGYTLPGENVERF